MKRQLRLLLQYGFRTWVTAWLRERTQKKMLRRHIVRRFRGFMNEVIKRALAQVQREKDERTARVAAAKIPRDVVARELVLSAIASEKRAWNAAGELAELYGRNSQTLAVMELVQRLAHSVDSPVELTENDVNAVLAFLEGNK